MFGSDENSDTVREINGLNPFVKALMKNTPETNRGEMAKLLISTLDLVYEGGDFYVDLEKNNLSHNIEMIRDNVVKMNNVQECEGCGS